MVGIRAGDQAGEGWFGFVYVLFTLGIFGLFILYSAPVYMTAYAVGDALRGAAHDHRLKNANDREIRDSVAKRMQVSYASSVSADKLKIRKVSNGRKLELEYTVDKHFLFNLGFRYSFDKSALMPAADD